MMLVATDGRSVSQTQDCKLNCDAPKYTVEIPQLTLGSQNHFEKTVDKSWHVLFLVFLLFVSLSIFSFD